jgi:glutathione S-transferase
MDSENRRPATTVAFHNPTDIVLGAAKLKGLNYTVQYDRRTLPEVPGPSLTLKDHIVVGEAAILGWLDRRYPCPELFPSPLDLYSKAATLAHGLTTNPQLAKSILHAHTNGAERRKYLFGPEPNIADLALWVALKQTQHPSALDWAEHLFEGELY